MIFLYRGVLKERREKEEQKCFDLIRNLYQRQTKQKKSVRINTRKNLVLEGENDKL